VSAFLVVVSLGTFLYFYSKYAAIVEDKLARGPYANTSKLYAAPEAVSVGDEVSADDIVTALQRAGYSESRSNRMGWFHVRTGGVEVFPGVDSYFQQEAHVVKIDGGRVAQIIALADNTQRTQFWLEPQLITNLFDRNREKRRPVRFSDIPASMKNALLAAEDKRFFNHAGFDPFRVLKSAWVDIKEGRNSQGASTLSMQLARILLLTNERSWRRKAPEILITLHLERKLTKEEIFEHYFNQVYVGRVGSFNIHGFGEAAQAYFGKDLKRLTLGECATLAGLVQSPSGYNPFKYPDRARRRRNIVLLMMRDNKFISPEEHDKAVAEQLAVKQGGQQSDDAPYFVDLVNDKLLSQFQDHDFQANTYRVYTALDLNLQRAAAEAMRAGLKEVDDLLVRKGRTSAKGWPKVQAAIVVLDSRTGELKALIGGRDYGESQLDRALSKRPSGSIFKPFVYSAVLSTAVDGSPDPFTPISRVIDEPTTFWFSGKAYEPNNYKGEFHGSVTLRQALAKSMNVPAVKFAEQVGYEKIVDVARKAGMNAVQATPAVALGAYEVQPIEIAGAYTIFPGRGTFTQPYWIKMIRDQDGRAIFTEKPVKRDALDPRVAYMATNLMEEVLRTGTAAGVRGRGFAQPAAGKTGTSHDGWFAGFTTELICVVWVGYDDYRELGLEGASSALPVWTEFMKRAHKLRPYRRATAFAAPDGIVQVEVDTASGKLGSCGPGTRPEVFLAGTQPLESCAGGVTQVASWDVDEPAVAPPSDEPRRIAKRTQKIHVPEPAEPQAGTARTEQPKRGFFGRILDVFK
jgi:penicillin-binding protein 1B